MEKKQRIFFKKNLSIFAGTAVVFSAFIGLYFIGKAYVNNSYYDFVMAITRKTTLNYSRGDGNTTSIAINFQDGLTVNNINDKPSRDLICNSEFDEAWGDDNLREGYARMTEEASIKVLDPSYNINDANRDMELSDSEVTSLTNISTQQWGIAENAVVDSGNQNFRFYIREDINWSTGEEIKASDFGYALINIMNIRQASPSEYIPYKYAMLKGAQEWHDHQNAAVNDPNMDEDWSLLYNLFYDVNAGDGGVNYITGEIQHESNRKNAAFVFDNEEGWLQYQILGSGNVAFPTILQNPVFLPVNQEWMEGKNAKPTDNYYLQRFGTSANSLSTYGAFNVTSFDPSYGIEFKKNENYHNADVVVSENINYRVINEPATQLSMFKSGALQTFQPDEIPNKTILFEDDYSNKWMDWQLGNPTTRYAIFNLDPGNDGAGNPYGDEAAKHYKNANFRKAFYYAFDRSDFSRFSGSERAVPSSIITPSDFGGGFGDNTIVDLAYNTKFGDEYYENRPNGEYYLSNYKESARSLILNTPQKEMDAGKNYERGTNEATNKNDPRTNFDLSQYYWDKYVAEINKIDDLEPASPSNQITLRWMTDRGDSDPMVASLRSAIDDSPLSGAVNIEIVPIIGSTIPYWRGTYGNRAGDNGQHSWDMLELWWSPDIGDPWGALSVYNATNRAKTFNLSPTWNFWTGSEETYGITYTDVQRRQIDQHWEKDGFVYNDDLIYLLPDEIRDASGEVLLDDIHGWINDNVGEEKLIDVTITDGTGEPNDTNDILKFKNVTGPTQEVIFGLEKDEQAKLYLLMEALNQNSIPSLQIGNALPNSVPNKSPFSSTPKMGYVAQIYSYNPSKFAHLGLPNENWILKSRGVI